MSGLTCNGRLASVIKEPKQPIGMFWDCQIYDVNVFISLTGLPDDLKASKMDGVTITSDTQRLADHAKWISSSPACASSAPIMGRHGELGIETALHMLSDQVTAKLGGVATTIIPVRRS